MVKIKVYNSSEKLVFEGSEEEFLKFPVNDGDKITIEREK